MRIYRTADGCTIENGGSFARSREFDIDALFTASDPTGYAREQFESGETVAEPVGELLPPLGSQEVWAAGVTYFRSRTARMEESESSGGDRFYDMVYDADRPELFFKATPARCRGLATRRPGKSWARTLVTDMACR